MSLTHWENLHGTGNFNTLKLFDIIEGFSSGVNSMTEVPKSGQSNITYDTNKVVGWLKKADSSAPLSRHDIPNDGRITDGEIQTREFELWQEVQKALKAHENDPNYPINPTLSCRAMDYAFNNILNGGKDKDYTKLMHTLEENHKKDPKELDPEIITEASFWHSITNPQEGSDTPSYKNLCDYSYCLADKNLPHDASPEQRMAEAFKVGISPQATQKIAGLDGVPDKLGPKDFQILKEKGLGAF